MKNYVTINNIENSKASYLKIFKEKLGVNLSKYCHDIFFSYGLQQKLMHTAKVWFVTCRGEGDWWSREPGIPCIDHI